MAMTAIDPADYTVVDVEEWVVENWHDHRNDATFVSVHNAERDGKARVSLLDWLDHFAEDHAIDLTPRPGTQAAEPGTEPIVLFPTSVDLQSPDITLTVSGTLGTFNSRSVIIFNGGNEPTTLHDPSTVSTIVKPSTASGPATVPVWVWTDGTFDTAAAFFTFTGQVTPPGPDPTTSDEMLTAQLRSWGISGEPTRWAPSVWYAVIESIRFANTGFGTLATVQGLLDSTFPLNDIKAADVCITSLAELSVQSTGAEPGTHQSWTVGDLDLPADNVTWYLDTLVVGHGNTLELEVPPGEHTLDVEVAVAGNVYSRREIVTGT